MTDPSGATVWLASFPKSGNTWFRAVLTALSRHALLFDLNHLESGGQPYAVGSAIAALGIDTRWLTADELRATRGRLVLDAQSRATEGLPLFRKTHEVYRSDEGGHPPFPLEATRAAVLITRDPRDVACSYAPFFGIDVDKAIRRMGRERTSTTSAARGLTEQPWGTWSSHTESWLSDEVPFPVHHVRYEDMHSRPVETLTPVLRAVGLEVTTDEVADAVDRTRFDRLQEREQRSRFRETAPATQRFFRSGRSGGWREELTSEQVLRIEADHAPLMERLGYELTSPREDRAALRRTKDSVARSKSRPWWHLPPELGIDVRLGTAPRRLPGAAQPRPWAQVRQGEALVRFQQAGAIWVRGGNDVVIDLEDAEGDPSWMVNGWGVTLCTLQRGNLSVHASTVRIGDRIVAVAGRRGAGKSTTSMSLLARGHELLVDDVTLVDLEGPRATVTPYQRNVHLLEQSSIALDLDHAGLPALAGRGTKVAYTPEERAVEPVDLDVIVVLRPNRSASRVTSRVVGGRERIGLLLNHLARDGVAPAVLGQDRYFDLVTRLCSSVAVHEVIRPLDDWTLDVVVDAVEAAAGYASR